MQAITGMPRGVRKNWSKEQLKAMLDFMECVIDAGLNHKVEAGVARDFANEILDMLVDAKIDVQEILEAKVLAEMRDGGAK